MLSCLDMKVVAAIHESLFYCWPCAARILGQHGADRLRAGLGIGAPDWERALRWEVFDRARFEGEECNIAEHPKADDFCVACAETLCGDCGTRLDVDEPAPALERAQ